MSEIYLSLGSNIGDRQKFISQAIDRLSKQIDIIQSSQIYETKPWGKIDQQIFLNMCLFAKTNLSAEDLMIFAKNVETNIGRSHSEKWGPREIDIDILFYGDEIIDSNELKIPHPHLAERAFVLVPLNEIASNLIHPTLNKKISELMKNVDPTGVKLYEVQ